MKTLEFKIENHVEKQLMCLIGDSTDKTFELNTDAFTISWLQASSTCVYTPALTTDIELQGNTPKRRFCGKCLLSNGVTLHLYWKL